MIKRFILAFMAVLITTTPVCADDDGEDEPGLDHRHLRAFTFQWQALPSSDATASFTGSFLMQGRCPNEVNIASLPDAKRVTGDVNLTVDANSIYISCGR